MPVVFNKNIDEQTILSVWKIEETETELLDGLQLKAHELEFISSLNNGKRLLHWLSTRLLLRKMLNTAEYIDCRMDEHGKPYLVNSDYEISLSHSFDYAAVIISKDKKVGVDIELIKDKIKKIQGKFLTDLELSQLNDADNTLALYICWCAKEAIYKWNGRKGLEFKQDIHIYPFQTAEHGSIQSRVGLPEGTAELQVEYFKVEDNYMLGYVVAK
jgi:4'-phosphopantetheinyl transferase